jgi:hypothetical protein
VSHIRIDGQLAADKDGFPLAEPRIVFICGSNGLVESASAMALPVGVDRRMIRTERLGPTG